MQILRSFYNLVRKLDNFLGMTAMAFIILLACANVFMRYVVGRPWGWVEEVTVFTFVWLTMLGASAVVHVEGHCSIDVLVRRFPSKWQRAVSIFGDLVVLVTLVLLIWFGILLTIKGQTKLTPILGIPYSYVDASVPVSCFFMLMYYGRMFWNSLRGEKNTTNLDDESVEPAQ
ncbi:TRAP transporter small permease [Propionivibrio dicarboxylicus]|uniref:TRAP transporter small permease protein n=1 Tax=Propionivibrio dicarboxylicus TaxID=83767 RepID=A0A1G8JXX2_9RHOO|nr:TRAP transporter small permease [Propionivibrio dicarboxylicus]SDI36008.1 TRAP-type C4-dicarboxylate transport system, small permease component [Propionivibrio dicarboxylicus]